MTTAEDDPSSTGRKHLVAELSEDLDVAIREFLERNPGTSPQRIRSAMRRVERRTVGGRLRGAAALACLAAFVVGMTIGLMLG